MIANNVKISQEVKVNGSFTFIRTGISNVGRVCAIKLRTKHPFITVVKTNQPPPAVCA